MQHAFAEREDVKYIYGITFGIRHQMLRIRVFLDSWWKTKAIKYNLMIQAIPLLIVWELWKVRCSCKYIRPTEVCVTQFSNGLDPTQCDSG